MNREPVGLVIVERWIDLSDFFGAKKDHPRRQVAIKALVLEG